MVDARIQTTYLQDLQDIESVMEHFEYCIKLMGIDAVGFGPDTLIGDHVALPHLFTAHLSMSQFRS